MNSSLPAEQIILEPATFEHWWHLKSKDMPLYLARAYWLAKEAFAAGQESMRSPGANDHTELVRELRRIAGDGSGSTLALLLHRAANGLESATKTATLHD